MKIYLDVCCLSRPFDDQIQYRVRLESEAILIILHRFYVHEWEWIGSEAIEIEVGNTPDIGKRQHLAGLASYIHKSVKIRDNEVRRSGQPEKLGFKSFDAMHIACSESGDADYFLTTDDKLLRLTGREKEKLNVRTANPLYWLTEVISNESRIYKSVSDTSDGN